MTDPDASRLRRWLRMIEWAAPASHHDRLVRSIGKAARAALSGEHAPENIDEILKGD